MQIINTIFPQLSKMLNRIEPSKKGATRLTLIFSACVLSCGLHAQQIVMPSALAANSFGNGLFNFVSTDNGENGSSYVQVRATLTRNGRKYAEENGVGKYTGGVLSGYDLQSEGVTILDPTMNQELFQLGLLPEGRYGLCIEIQGAKRAEECTSFTHVIRPNPVWLRLASPSNGSIIPYKNPLFVWSSIQLPNETNGLSYSIYIAEKSSDNRLNGFNSIATNTIFSQQGIIHNSLLYPPSAYPLEAGGKYIWMVELRAGQELLARSPVWDFVIDDEEFNESQVSLSYIDLNEVSGSHEFHFLGSMKIKYTSISVVEKVEVQVFNEKGKRLKLKQNEIELSRSNPYAEYSFEKESKVKHLKKYRVELTPANGDRVVFNMVYLNPLFVELQN